MNPNKQDSHFLSLIVPAYKQEKTIVQNLKQLEKVLEEIRYDYEVIVIVDGMVDQTFSKIKKAKLKKLTCLAYKENHGKSYALRLGMRRAKGDYIMFIDSGLEIDPNGISMLLEHMEWYDADVIVGSKRHLASKVEYVWQRKVLSYGYFYLVKLLFGIKVKDTQAGIKIFKKKVLEKILPRLVEKRFAGDLEMLVVAKHLGFDKIYEAPIKLSYKFKGISSASTLRSIRGIFLDTLAIFYRKNLLKHYNKSHYRFGEPSKIHSVKYS
jgi:glycosyltransferase involved in cell wall biosynthesis